MTIARSSSSVASSRHAVLRLRPHERASSGTVAGRSEVALVFGSDATSTNRYFAGADNKPDFSETVDGSLEDRGHGLDGIISRYTVIHGLVDAPTQYGLLENARRAGTGLGPADYLRRMGELFAPFTKVAAENPFAAAPVERTPLMISA